jgi:deazaflavin-dependent oxidoreductase (nitroreductase family)
MVDEPITVTEMEASRADWVSDHIAEYIASGGLRGHVVDFTPIGGHPFSKTLLLRARGRKTGTLRVNALTYGSIDGKVIIIGSKGGADIHPAWYHNIQGTQTVDIQIGGHACRATWQEVHGAERADLWAFMERVYPPYGDYQAGTKRKIPLLVLTPGEEIELFRA